MLVILSVVLAFGVVSSNMILFTESMTGYVVDIETRVYDTLGEAHIYIKFENSEMYSVFRISDYTEPFSEVIMENKTCVVTWYSDSRVYRNLLSIDIVDL
jgi:hypothetical protein